MFNIALHMGRGFHVCQGLWATVLENGTRPMVEWLKPQSILTGMMFPPDLVYFVSSMRATGSVTGGHG